MDFWQWFTLGCVIWVVGGVATYCLLPRDFGVEKRIGMAIIWPIGITALAVFIVVMWVWSLF